MIGYMLKAGHGPGYTWPITGRVHASREDAVLEAEAREIALRSFDGVVAVWIAKVRRAERYQPRRPGVTCAHVAAPVLRKAR